MNAEGSDKRVILLDQGTQSLSSSADGKWIATRASHPAPVPTGVQRIPRSSAATRTGAIFFNGSGPSPDLDPDPNRQVTHETQRG